MNSPLIPDDLVPMVFYRQKAAMKIDVLKEQIAWMIAHDLIDQREDFVRFRNGLQSHLRGLWEAFDLLDDAEKIKALNEPEFHGQAWSSLIQSTPYSRCSSWSLGREQVLAVNRMTLPASPPFLPAKRPPMEPFRMPPGFRVNKA